MDSLFLHPIGLAYISGMNIANCIKIELKSSNETDVTASYDLGDYDCGAILPSSFSFNTSSQYSVYGAAWFAPGITGGMLIFFGETYSTSASPSWLYHQNFTLYGSITTNSSSITFYWPKLGSPLSRTFSGTLYTFKR